MALMSMLPGWTPAHPRVSIMLPQAQGWALPCHRCLPPSTASRSPCTSLPSPKHILHHFEMRHQSEKQYSNNKSSCFSTLSPARKNSDSISSFFGSQLFVSKHKYLLWTVSIIIYVERFLQAIWFGFELTYFQYFSERTWGVLVFPSKIWIL